MDRRTFGGCTLAAFTAAMDAGGEVKLPEGKPIENVPKILWSTHHHIFDNRGYCQIRSVGELIFVGTGTRPSWFLSNDLVKIQPGFVRVSQSFIEKEDGTFSFSIVDSEIER